MQFFTLAQDKRQISADSISNVMPECFLYRDNLILVVYIFWLKMNPLLFQVIAALIVNMAALSSGLSLGFSAIVLPQLKANMTENPEIYQPFHLNMESGSWVASIFGIGAIFGGFATAYLGNYHHTHLFFKGDKKKCKIAI